MWLFIAIGSAVLFGLAGLFMKVSQMRAGSVNWLLLGLYVSGTAGFAVHMLVSGTSVVLLYDVRVWLAGLLIGCGSGWGNLVFMRALDYGPASLTSPLTNMNIVLVVAMGAFVYAEPLGVWELVGIACLLAAVGLISIRGRERLTIAEKRWFLLVALAIGLFAIRNGGLKVTESMALPSAPILFIAYLFSVVLFIGAALRERRQKADTAARDKLNARQTPGEPSSSAALAASEASAALVASEASSALKQAAIRTGWRWGLGAGLFSYAGLQLYALALETGKASIAAPIFATNSLVVAIGAIVWFRERLTPLQGTALALAFLGLVLLRL